MSTTRFGISLDDALLERFDRLIRAKGYGNRSEAIRDLIRDSLVAEEWKSAAEAVGTVTIVYSHDKKDLADMLTDLQHRYHNAVVSAMHIHLAAHRCLEVIVVKGKTETIKEIANRLRGTKGVIHGDLSMTTTGKSLK